MQRQLKAIVVMIMFVLGIISVVNAQQDLLDNLKIVSIKSIQVREKGGDIFMDIETAITNSNEKKIRLNGGDFTFSLHSEYYPNINKDNAFDSEGTIIEKDEKQEIGSDKKDKDIDLDPKTEKDPNVVMFHVNIGRSHKEALGTLTHLMNCIGYPAIKKPVITIKGRFNLGVYSEKGLTEVEAVKITWIFIPEIQDRVNFMTSAS